MQLDTTAPELTEHQAGPVPGSRTTSPAPWSSWSAPPWLGPILSIWAHPDDETYLSGGLLAAAVDAGQSVTVLTATDGAAGFADDTLWPTHRAASVRRREGAAAMAALGVTDHRWLGYPDGGCDRVAVGAAAAQIRRVVDEIRPTTILTFGPDGATGHPDHKAVSRWVDAAVPDAPGSPRVLHATTDPDFAARFEELHRRFEVFLEPGLPRVTPRDELAVHLRLTGDLLDRKLVALRAMATQTWPVIQAFGDEAFAEWVAEEAFVERRRR